MRIRTNSLTALTLVLGIGLFAGCADSAGEPQTAPGAPFSVGDRPSDVLRAAGGEFTVTYEWTGAPPSTRAVWVLRQSGNTRRWDSALQDDSGAWKQGYSTIWDYQKVDVEPQQDEQILSCVWALSSEDVDRVGIDCRARYFTFAAPSVAVKLVVFDQIVERLPDREVLGQRAYCWRSADNSSVCVTGDGIPLYARSPKGGVLLATEGWDELEASMFTRSILAPLTPARELASRLPSRAVVSRADYDMPPLPAE